jgi:hypothetical protein
MTHTIILKVGGAGTHFARFKLRLVIRM